MKTSEFIKRVEELGCKVLDSGLTFEIVDELNRSLVTIGKTDEFLFDSNRVFFKNKEEDFKVKLFNLVVEYVTTPIEDRKEEKKYYIRPKDMDTGDGVWNYENSMKSWVTADKRIQGGYIVQFTRKEIKELTGQELEHYSYCEVGTDTWKN